MPSDQDELDLILRAAMKTLDDQVPSGYFEGLPRQTLMRLEGGAMTQTTAAGTEPNSSLDMSTIDMAHVDMKPTESGRIHAETENAVPTDRDEDSGLHDIRSLAQSTKQRLSSKITAVRPDEDILAASSASWKNVALPEPARMVSLPEIAELPSKQEIKAKAKADKKPALAVPVDADADAIAPQGKVVTPAVAAVAVESSSSMIGSRIAAKANPGSRTKTLAFVGLGLAAAAGVTFYLVSQGKADKPDKVALQSTPPPTTVAAEIPKAAAIAAPAAQPMLDEVATGSAAPSDTAVEPAIAAPATKAAKPEKTAAKGAAVKSRTDEPEVKPPAKDPKAVEKPGPERGKGEGKEGEPSFDDLLKEAGVKDKQVVKPKLDKKSLSGEDIKRGMGAVAGKAQACFAGTQGTAAVKLTVTPDGKVSKVAVAGAFANTPVGECVANAVRSTSFPAWEGGPQSFGYSYLLEEK